MKQAVFLDRDGVINEVLSKRVKFVNDANDFYLLDGVAESIRSFKKAGFLVFVVTNQGGIGLGYMREEQLVRIHEKMIADLNVQAAIIDDIAYCPHKPNEGCPCRKPKAYLLEKLAEKHHVDLSASIMVGDREPDIRAGQKAGCQTVLVNPSISNDFQANACFPDLRSAVPWILSKKY
ncbi:D-glycero-alpha-D-manno-heptose-1,7-bisphosphate 7-phosphatase [Shouchella clausii]|uniref:D,D-heptose 1,7-bisphosphate phosphatase n=1 Tax=Shouchella clausii TaxID=79880 RepID=A0A268NVW0_SHOCL|nr:HAD family hydrolase [Shouchella clausii]PAE87642.1 D-glycero-beta-D-manno-heptose-1,7-bisphosphate 7-phosphatase [Shouchella clausii]